MVKKLLEGYPEKEEILHYILLETAQKESVPTDSRKIMDFLKLRLVEFDFTEFGTPALEKGRAILSYNQRVVAINTRENRGTDFPKFHEIAHYVLPNHREKLFYLCDKEAMSPATKNDLEMEANLFAADLIYKGNQFSIESNSVEISFNSIVSLATKYGSSIESTTRRFVERSLFPCMSMVYTKEEEHWKAKYWIFSKPFLEKYLKSNVARFSDDDNEDVIKAELQPNQIIESECRVNIRGEKETAFSCEYYFNNYNVLGLIKEERKI